MTQVQLHRAVAVLTGESVTTIHRLGFGLLSNCRDEPKSEDIRLVLDCPFCGRQVDYPGQTRSGQALAECLHCDVYFDFEVGDVYAADYSASEEGRS